MLYSRYEYFSSRFVKEVNLYFESRLHSKMDMKMKWHVEDPRVFLRRLTKDDWKVDV